MPELDLAAPSSITSGPSKNPLSRLVSFVSRSVLSCTGDTTWTVQRRYQIPRKVIVRSLERLDAVDSPERPGMMYEGSLKAMVERFDKVFGNIPTAAKKQARSGQVAAVMDHLHRHTRRRRGDTLRQEGIIEWEQTSRVYELFSVDLNVFERIFFTIDVSESTTVLSQVCNIFLVCMILLSILGWMVSTLPEVQTVPADCVGTEIGDCQPMPVQEFAVIELVCVYVFTVEYLIRLFTVHSVRFALLDEFFLENVLANGSRQGSTRPTAQVSRQYTDENEERIHKNKLDSKLMTTFKHVTNISNVIDLLAIVPYWIEVVSQAEDAGGGALLVLRILRLTRIFRVFKLGKYNEVFTLFSRVIVQSVPALSLMLFFITLGCCLFGTLMWFAEQGQWYPPGHPKLAEVGVYGRGAYLRHSGSLDPDEYHESPFYSIVHSFWYVIATITTVGYGDVSPTTPVGKIVGSVTILNGIVVLAMPIGVVGANFSNEYYRVLEEKKRRKRLKEQLQTLAAVEEEQDAALRDANTVEECREDGAELHRVGEARKRILSQAEDVDKRFQLVFPPILYNQISRSLRLFVRDFLHSDHHTMEANPMVSPAHLETLDSLTSRVHVAIIASTSLEEFADFGLRDARALRVLWAEFVDRCWSYVIEMCHVEKQAEPPEFFQLKMVATNTLQSNARGESRAGSSVDARRNSSKLLSRTSSPLGRCPNNASSPDQPHRSLSMRRSREEGRLPVVPHEMKPALSGGSSRCTEHRVQLEQPLPGMPDDEKEVSTIDHCHSKHLKVVPQVPPGVPEVELGVVSIAADGVVADTKKIGEPNQKALPQNGSVELS